MEEEDEEAIEFIESYQQVKIAYSMEKFEPGKNLLHKYAYGAVSEFLLNELPNDAARREARQVLRELGITNLTTRVRGQ